MGRAPHPGGPQRVTAHVVPRAKPFPDGDEEEKTTLESPWEDEASTTVEEGDVADKIRSLGLARGSNNTSVTGTGALDEPTVDDQHANMSAITPVRDVARLQITQGNDAGQEFEIRPGKTYTIGRALDNDIVLTDIAVSRKHFDLRFEDGAWVIVDRGSGNGTVVNGNLEDNPFMLANGDVIEIGNTVFRFDQPSAAARPQPTMEIDDEELSTVAGKPMRNDLEIAQQRVASRHQPRSKTLPPPAPRSASASQPPPLGFPPAGPAPIAQPAPALSMPQSMPQMSTRPPLGSPAPHAPTMLGDPHAAMSTNGMPTAHPASQSQQRPIYAYPQVSEIPPHSVHAQMLLIQTQNRRGDGSTALVPPVPYDGLPPPPPRYSQPQLTRRTKHVLAGVGLAVLAAILTIAITKSGGPSATTAQKGDAKAKAAAKTSAEPIVTPAEDEPPLIEIDEPPPAPAKTVPQPAATPAEPSPTVAAKTAPEPEKTEPKVVEKPEKPEVEKKPEPKVVARPKPEPVKVAAKAKAEPKTTKRERERREVRRDPEPPPPKRVAAAVDPEDAKNRADKLYRAKKFSDASSLLASAAKNADDADARDLRRTSDIYAKLGRAFAQGTAPATKPTTAFEALRQAQMYDRNVGNAFDDEIQTKLAQVAPKAALSYMAAKNYPQARTAVITAQQFGSSESVKIVSQKLESVAGELYNAAMRELSSNPSAAREKFKQITTIVDSKSTWFQKAQKQLKGS